MEALRTGGGRQSFRDRDHTMRKVVVGLLLASVCVTFTGCGGCGLSESQMRRRSRTRDPNDELPPANQASTAAAVPITSPTPTPPPAATTNPAPATTAAKLPIAAPATSPSPAAATPGPPGPIQVVIQNPKPAKPLTAVEKRQLSLANLRKLGQALTAHVQRTGALPAVVRDDQGGPLLSWRVVLLPDLGYGELYRQFRLGEPWDSPHNVELLGQNPPEFNSPERFDRKTNYLGLAGSGQAFGAPRGTVPIAMEDGPENTVVLVEVDDGGEAFWTAPVDYVSAADATRGGLGGLRGDGVFALLGTGKVVLLGSGLPDHEFLALLSPDGGEHTLQPNCLASQPNHPSRAAMPAVNPLLTAPSLGAWSNPSGAGNCRRVPPTHAARRSTSARDRFQSS
jgi:hypothetical protein